MIIIIIILIIEYNYNKNEENKNTIILRISVLQKTSEIWFSDLKRYQVNDGMNAGHQI